MKKNHLILLLFLFNTTLLLAQSPQEQFIKAKELFDNGKNSACITSLQSIEKQTGANPKIYSLYTNAYLADKDYTNAAIYLNKFKRLVGNKRTDAIQSILDLEKEINSGVETAENKHKETVARKRMEEANQVVAALKKTNEQKKSAILKEKNEQVSSIPVDAILRVAKDKDGAYGYIDENNILVIDAKFDMAFPFKDGKALVSIRGKWSYIDLTGKILQNLSYSVVSVISDKLLSFKENNLHGFMNNYGQVLHRPQYSDVSIYLGLMELKLIEIKNQNKLGLMNYEGKLIASPQFDQIVPFSNGTLRVRINDLHGIIDVSGKLVVPIKYKVLGEKFSEGLIRFSNGGPSGFLDLNGNIVIEAKQYCYADFSDGLVKISKDASGFNVGYMDKTGKIVIPMKYPVGRDFSEGLAMVAKGKSFNYKYGYIDKAGKEVIPIGTFSKGGDAISSAFSEGLAVIEISPFNHLVIDKTGKQIHKITKYKYVYGFHDDLACVGNANSYGFIDRNGREIIPLQFQYSSKFENGEAKVFLQNGNYIRIDKTGKKLGNVY